MLIAAAVVPGAPALVAELMGLAAHELDDLRCATDRAVSGVLADLMALSAGSLPSASSPGSAAGSGPAQLMVVGPGQAGEFDAAGPVSFAGFGRDVLLPAMDDGESGDPALPTPIMVARYLASRDIAAHPDHAQLWASARWMTTDGVAATALGQQLRAGGALVGLILVADGAACHGPKAPRAEDIRAQAYDGEVCAALSSGQLGRLAEIDADLGVDLGATWPQVWPVLVAAGDSDGFGDLLWAGAPYGVGWAVASWRRKANRTTRTNA